MESFVMRDVVEARKARLHQLVDGLPPERLDAAEGLLEHLIGKLQSVKLGGLWENLGVGITEGEIAQARKEMWGRFGGDR